MIVPRRRTPPGAVALLGLASCTCNTLAGQGAQIEQFGRELVSLRHLDLPGGLPQVELSQVLPSRLFAEPDLRPPRLVCTVDVEGTTTAAGHPSQRVVVSDVGLERIPVQLSDRAVLAAGSPLPGLAGVLSALQHRDAAQGDASRLAALTTDTCPQRPRLPALVQAAGADDPPTRWLIRTDPEGAKVTEERQSGRRLASDLQRQGDTYLFANGVVVE